MNDLDRAKQIRSRLVRLLAPREWPGWTGIILGIAERIALQEERVRHAFDVAREMGGHTELLASVLESPLFSIALIGGGLGYLIFVGEPPKGVQRNPAWSIIAWCVLAVCATSVIAVPFYGAVELYIRGQIIKGIAGVPRGNPSDSGTSGNQKPIFGAARNLTPDQSRILYVGALKIKSLLPKLMITWLSSDNESYNYMIQFRRIIMQAGIQAPLDDQLPDGPNQTGIMIDVPDLDHIPEAARRLEELLIDMDLKPKFISTPKNVAAAATPLALYIGPQPLQLSQ